MSYDDVVVGAGLTGLTAGLRLAEEGRRVLVLAKGPGAMHLSSGTVDVLGYAPDRVDHPAQALAGLAASQPNHPYALIPPEVIKDSLTWFRTRARPFRYLGGLEENLLLPTAVGVPKPTALVPESMAPGDLRQGGRFVIVGFRALKDFYPGYVADNLSRSISLGRGLLSARGLWVDASPGGEADVNSLGFARRFEDPGFRAEVIRELKPWLEPGERVGFPAALGLADPDGVWRAMQEGLDAPVFEIPTLPPSVPGIRSFNAMKAALAAAGGRLILGTRVEAAEQRDGMVERVVATTAARPASYRARRFVVASGGFASGGIDMDSFGRVRETVFGLAVAGVPPERPARFGSTYLGDQPMARAGLAVDERFHPIGDGGHPPFVNLYAAGASVAGAEPWREKSGDGISLATGFRVAQLILEDES